MRVSQLQFPAGVAQPDSRSLHVFRTEISENSEVCNECFQRIRSIGELKERRTSLFSHYFNEHYERTEFGSQEHDPFSLPTDRYGTCYCTDCGTAANRSSTSEILSLDQMTERVQNIYRYLRCHTDHDPDPNLMGQTLARLKRQRNNQGLDAEIFAVATANALE